MHAMPIALLNVLAQGLAQSLAHQALISFTVPAWRSYAELLLSLRSLLPLLPLLPLASVAPPSLHLVLGTLLERPDDPQDRGHLSSHGGSGSSRGSDSGSGRDDRTGNGLVFRPQQGRRGGGGPPLVVLEGSAARSHLRVLATSGSGKSFWVATLILQLLNLGVGLCLVDPHGDLCDTILTALADLGFFADPRAYERLWYLDFSRTDRFVAWNVLDQPFELHIMARLLVEAWKRAWSSLASGEAVNLENILLASTYLLAEAKQPLTQLQRVLTDAPYRHQLLAQCGDAAVISFFRDRYDALGRRMLTLIESTLRRAFLLTFTPALRYTLGQRTNRLQFRPLMDRGTSILVNLGGLDPDTQRMLGCLLTVGLEEAALSREDLPAEQRRPYTLIVDEYSQFAAQSETALARILALTRKYGLQLIAAQQSLSQTGRKLEGAWQNALQVVGRVGREDAAVVAPRLFTPDPLRLKERPDMRPTYMSAADQRLAFEEELMALAPREAFVRLGCQTVKFRSLGLPAPRCSRAQLEAIKDRYARLLLTSRAEIEAEDQAPAPAQADQPQRAGDAGRLVSTPDELQHASRAPRAPRAVRRDGGPSKHAERGGRDPRGEQAEPAGQRKQREHREHGVDREPLPPPLLSPVPAQRRRVVPLPLRVPPEWPHWPPSHQVNSGD